MNFPREVCLNSASFEENEVPKCCNSSQNVKSPICKNVNDKEDAETVYVSVLKKDTHTCHINYSWQDARCKHSSVELWTAAEHAVGCCVSLCTCISFFYFSFWNQSPKDEIVHKYVANSFEFQWHAGFPIWERHPLSKCCYNRHFPTEHPLVWTKWMHL